MTSNINSEQLTADWLRTQEDSEQARLHYLPACLLRIFLCAQPVGGELFRVDVGGRR